ncbi:CLP protease regulatory subunit X [Striga asiatica]|uniref:CLP protease regulatory subunit X n=1 Tax=Striga asiatica TaxID=4170 RepID=A0A5A7RA38_STRAF|nr:CLP protease regulatory subunit X [Striga asiatica]
MAPSDDFTRPVEIIDRVAFVRNNPSKPVKFEKSVSEIGDSLCSNSSPSVLALFLSSQRCKFASRYQTLRAFLTLNESLCVFPSNNSPRKGVISKSYDGRSNEPIPVMGLHMRGFTPPAHDNLAKRAIPRGSGEVICGKVLVRIVSEPELVVFVERDVHFQHGAVSVGRNIEFLRLNVGRVLDLEPEPVVQG